MWARANADLIRSSGLAIYMDAGDEDFLNAHDGAEFLHRLLWDLDISHEYHLVRAVDAWIDGGMAGNPPAAAPTSQEFMRILRAQFRPLRAQAANSDPTTNRRYGVLPDLLQP